MERSAFVAWAKQLTGVQLATLFYEILGDFPRSPSDYYHGEAIKDQVPSGASKLVIAEAGYFAGFGSEPAGYDIEVIAPPTDYSSSKLSQCPICGTENWGT